MQECIYCYRYKDFNNVIEITYKTLDYQCNNSFHCKMKSVLLLIVIISINFVVCKPPKITTTTAATTVPIQCTIPICKENEKIIVDEVTFCGVCVPKKSKKRFNGNKLK